MPNDTTARRSVVRRSADAIVTGTSAHAQATAVYSPQLCVYSSAVNAAVKTHSAGRLPSTNARTNEPATTMPRTATSEYMRVSREKYVMNGLTAASPLVIHAARSSNTRRATNHATGTIRIPKTSDMACVATTDVPNTAVQTCSSQYQSGGDPSRRSRCGMSASGWRASPTDKPSSTQYQVLMPSTRKAAARAINPVSA